MRSPPESTRSVRGHLIAYHLLGKVVIGNDAIVTHRVVVFHDDSLEVLARETNLIGCALPQDGHTVCGNSELA